MSKLHCAFTDEHFRDFFWKPYLGFSLILSETFLKIGWKICRQNFQNRFQNVSKRFLKDFFPEKQIQYREIFQTVTEKLCNICENLLEGLSKLQSDCPWDYLLFLHLSDHFGITSLKRRKNFHFRRISSENFWPN